MKAAVSLKSLRPSQEINDLSMSTQLEHILHLIYLSNTGKLATAVLSGILTTASTPGEEATEAVKSGSVRFNACVSSRDSAARLRETFAEHPDKVTVLEKHNLRGVREASIVVLGCKPVVYQSVLAEGGMREALDGKLLLSMLAGVSSKQITDAIYGVEASHEERTRCKVLRAIPSVAASIRNSTTVIEQSPNIEHKEASSAAESLFLRIGRVKFLPSDQIEVGAVLAASTPAFFALLVNAVAQGGVDQGMEKTLALELAAGTSTNWAEGLTVSTHSSARVYHFGTTH